MPLANDLDSSIGALVYGQRTILYTTQEFPTRNALVKLPPDEQIEIVCERYKHWLLSYARKLAQEPNTGYALLALLNSYFDMIASLSGHFSERSSNKRVKLGLPMVFRELATEPQVVTMLVKYLRNPMAHMGTTSDHIILIDLYEEPIVWGSFHALEAIVINPRLWAMRICEHFDEFVNELRDPDPKYNQRRKDFLDRISQPA